MDDTEREAAKLLRVKYVPREPEVTVCQGVKVVDSEGQPFRGPPVPVPRPLRGRVKPEPAPTKQGREVTEPDGNVVPLAPRRR